MLVFEIDVDVEVIRHHRVAEDADTAELLDAADEVDEPILLSLVEEVRTMRNPRNEVVAAIHLERTFLSHGQLLDCIVCDYTGGA